MTAENIELIYEKLAEAFNVTVAQIQEYLPDFLRQFGLYMAWKDIAENIILVGVITIFAGGFLLLMMYDIMEDAKLARRIAIIGIVIIVICVILCNIAHFIWPEFYAIEVILK